MTTDDTMTTTAQTQPIPPRPEPTDRDIIEDVCRKRAEEVATHWLINPDDLDRKKLAVVLADHFDIDGYRFARNLETNAGFVPDVELVGLLHGDGDLRYFHQEAIKVWVSAYAIDVPFKSPQRITALGLNGRVHRIWPATAEVDFIPDDALRGGITVPVEKCRAL